MGGKYLLVHQHQIQQQGKKNSIKDVPKGCLAIKVGDEKQRFVIPVYFFNHPLFLQLLKGAEEEYGFDQKGTITIPCHVDQFLFVQDTITKEHQSHNHHIACFRV